MAIDLIGWDIGGAHLKAAALDGGRLVVVIQRPCPLWLGLAHFHASARAILAELAVPPDCLHAVTMTGELADVFTNREDGVFGLLNALSEHVASDNILVFAGFAGFLPASNVRPEDVPAIASANWLASGLFTASRIGQGLFIDLGSTTCDLLVSHDGKVLAQGYTDYERLRTEELVYCGVVRTSLMALAANAPFDGVWIPLMAEHFATTADVFRLTGELPGHADQSSTADGGAKTPEASARRLARLLGRDLESADMDAWRQLARYFRERQLARLADACQRQLSRGFLNRHAPVIGSGVGRFLVQELARRLDHPYLDFADLLPTYSKPSDFHAADCAPAVAVACLARPRHG
jgi:probable H4MPT-linked C1 transfer pathway protein